jgi:hypothetical protein
VADCRRRGCVRHRADPNQVRDRLGRRMGGSVGRSQVLLAVGASGGRVCNEGVNRAENPLRRAVRSRGSPRDTAPFSRTGAELAMSGKCRPASEKKFHTSRHDFRHIGVTSHKCGTFCCTCSPGRGIAERVVFLR